MSNLITDAADIPGLCAVGGVIAGSGYLLSALAMTVIGTVSLPLTLFATAGAIALVFKGKARR